MRSKIHSYLGFARKSGNLATGYDTCLQLMKKKKIKLMIITEDASSSTKQKFQNLAEAQNLPFYIYGTAEELAQATGLDNRNIYGILEKNFAEAIAKEIQIMRE